MFIDVRDIRQLIVVIYFGDDCNKDFPTRGIALLILNIDTRWRFVVGFTPRLLYPQERAFDTRGIEGRKASRSGLEQFFSTVGPWRQLYRAATGSPGICHFSFISNFHE
jgi:hypothetical protein